MSVDPKTHISEAMAILSGQAGEPSRADYVRVFDALNTAQSVPFAKAKLAALKVMGCGTAQNIPHACDLYYDAIISGFPPLLRDMAVILSADMAHAGMIRALLMRAAGAGDHVAAYLISAWERRAPPCAPSAINTQVLRRSINAMFNHSPLKPPRSMSEALPIFVHERALSAMQCDYIMAVGQPLLQPSKVVDGDAAKQAGYRTSDGAVFLPSHMDMPVIDITTRLARLAGAAPQQGEFLSLLRYRPGQEYRPHYDFLDRDDADYAKIKACGQRKATVLTYLNAGYEGGETDFPEVGFRYRGEAGDSLVFHNVDCDGQPLPQSLHAGCPVTRGEKWLVTLWVREKRFWPW